MKCVKKEVFNHDKANMLTENLSTCCYEYDDDDEKNYWNTEKVHSEYKLHRRKFIVSNPPLKKEMQCSLNNKIRSWEAKQWRYTLLE